MKTKIRTEFTGFSILAVMGLFSFLLIGFMGCATFRDMPTEAKVVMSYESMGAVLEAALPTLKGLCESGTMSADDCAEARMSYNEAARTYKYLGAIAVIAVDTGEDFTYQQVNSRLMELLIEIQHYTGEN